MVRESGKLLAKLGKIGTFIASIDTASVPRDYCRKSIKGHFYSARTQPGSWYVFLNYIHRNKKTTTQNKVAMSLFCLARILLKKHGEWNAYN